jgi:glc operon protein GlcG
MRDSKALTSADVDKIMQAARAEARENGWAMSIAIVDQSGLIWRVDRTDGAIPASPRIAEAKARTAALMRAPTNAIEERAADRLVMLGLPDLLLMQGGLPILVNDECVGAVGVSGALAPQDEQVARAGIDALD